MPRKSIGSYPANWPQIAEQTKEAACWCCIRCRHPHDPPNGYTLTVHHLDLNKSNCAWWNLAPLCQRCHLHIQAKVVFNQIFMFEHSIWMQPFVAGYIASLRELPTDREYVIHHLTQLLSPQTQEVVS